MKIRHAPSTISTSLSPLRPLLVGSATLVDNYEANLQELDAAVDEMNRLVASLNLNSRTSMNPVPLNLPTTPVPTSTSIQFSRHQSAGQSWTPPWSPRVVQVTTVTLRRISLRLPRLAFDDAYEQRESSNMKTRKRLVLPEPPQAAPVTTKSVRFASVGLDDGHAFDRGGSRGFRISTSETPASHDPRPVGFNVSSELPPIPRSPTSDHDLSFDLSDCIEYLGAEDPTVKTHLQNKVQKYTVQVSAQLKQPERLPFMETAV